MTSDSLVLVENVSKKYCRSLRQSMLYAAADIGRDALGIRGRSSLLRPGEFWAVDDVSFEVKRGECLGIIGANGAGKSTLLKMLNGIVRPDKGRIRMRGRVGALIEVGAGFHPMLSGRENIYVNGAILGMSKREIDRKFDQIVDFAELSSDVLDAPVKTYSSGMYVRLGFAIAVCCEPEVLLIDEVLSVGDVAFRGRCFKWIEEMRTNGTAIIVVTHHLLDMERISTQGLLLEQGKLVEQGNPSHISSRYRHLHTRSDFRLADGPNASTHLSHRDERLPVIEDVHILDSKAGRICQFPAGGHCQFAIDVGRPKDRFCGELRMWLWRQDVEIATGVAAIPWNDVAWSGPGEVRGQLRLMVMPGTYRLGIQIRGLGPHDFVSQKYSEEFCVTRHEAVYPYVPSHALDCSLLELAFAAPEGK